MILRPYLISRLAGLTMNTLILLGFILANNRYNNFIGSSLR